MTGVLAPYFLAHFVITPLAFYALFGRAVATVAFSNLLLAEVRYVVCLYVFIYTYSSFISSLARSLFAFMHDQSWLLSKNTSGLLATTLVAF